jgi:hypothetical protein
MPLESLPLASGYLKAMILDDPELSARVSVDIVNFRGGVTHGEMARRLFSGQLPDVLAFSVFGWNVRAFGALAETFKQLKPEGWAVFGGTHVTRQAERVFRENPAVDIVVNGEGEITFRELVRAHMGGCDRTDLADVEGISYQSPTGTPVTTTDRPRIEDLDVIPSPFLTGAIDLVDENGVFLYDVALVETNRGCPYKCAFCYWGGAVGQRVRAFSRSRLRAELELFAKLKVRTVVACDANFGMMPIDLELVEDLIEIKEKYGFPSAFETSWAKNKSKVFYEIVHRMKDAELRSSFTLALQSLSPDALDTMLLPNTDYSDNKDVHGIIALRGDQDDFEYVLAHRTMSFADNARMQRFLFWARVVAENAVLRYCWLPLRKFAGWQQSRVLGSLADWADTSPRPEAAPLREAAARAHGGGAPAYATAIGYLFTNPAGRSALRHWWEEAVGPELPAAHRAFLDEVFRYDLLTQPVCPTADTGSRPAADPVFPNVEELRDRDLYVRKGVLLGYDLPALLPQLRASQRVDVSPTPTEVDLYYRSGALNAVLSTNHEEIVHFMGVPQYVRHRSLS